MGTVVGPAQLAEFLEIIAGRVLEDRWIERDDESAALHVVIEQRPRHRVEPRADAEESAEGHDRIDHPAADLLDREVVDMAEARARAIEHRGFVDPAGKDERLVDPLEQVIGRWLVHDQDSCRFPHISGLVGAINTERLQPLAPRSVPSRRRNPPAPGQRPNPSRR